METKMQFITRMIKEGYCKEDANDIDKYSKIYDEQAYWETPDGKEEWKDICSRLERTLKREIKWNED